MASCAPVAAENGPAKEPDSAPEKQDPVDKPREWFVRGVTLIATSQGRHGPESDSKVLAWDLTRMLYLARVGGDARRPDEALRFTVDSRGKKDGLIQNPGTYQIRVHEQGFGKGNKYRLMFRHGDEAKSQDYSIVVLPKPMASRLKEAVEAAKSELSLDFGQADEAGAISFKGCVTSSTRSLQPVKANWVDAGEGADAVPVKLDCTNDGAAIDVKAYEFKGVLETHNDDGTLVKKQTLHMVVSADQDWPVVLSLKENIWAVDKNEYEAWNYVIDRFVPAPQGK